MKKLAIAAALAAMAAPLMAQTTVYGVLDSSINSINKPSATTGTTTAYVDSAVIASRLGFRGSEDLGGGMRAIFQIETDVATNNGGTHQSGLFRRAAYVGLQTNSGEVTFGNRLNPLIATNSALMPLAGHSFDSTIASAFGYADFYTKNAVTYTSPVVGGLRAQVQYGLANTAGLDTAGSVTAGSLRWELGKLTVLAAGQDRKAGGTTSSANATATAAQGDVTTYMGGVQYKMTSALTAAAAYVKNEVAGVERSNAQYGVRYDLNPKTSVGVNRMISATADNSLTNVQARYAMSKRTTLYTQYAVADNASTYSVRALNTNTGSSPAVNVSGFAAVDNATQKAFGVGIIHTF